MDILKVDGINVTYPTFTMESVTFKLQQNRILAIIGENGAGKTTLLNVILGLKKINAGKIHLFNEKDYLNKKENKNNIGIVFDQNTLPSFMEVSTIEKIMRNIFSKWDSTTFHKYIIDADMVIRLHSYPISVPIYMALFSYGLYIGFILILIGLLMHDNNK